MKILIFSLVIMTLFFIGPMAARVERDLQSDLKRYQKAGPYFKEGKRLFQKGDNKKAVKELKACTERFPEHVFAHYYLSNIHYLNRDYPNALRNIKEALKFFDFMIQFTGYAREKKLEMINDFKDALGEYYESSNSCREGRRMEEAFLLMDQDERAVSSHNYNKWARLKSQYQSFHGSILYQLKKYNESYQQYMEAVKSDPQNGQAINNIVAILYMSGRHREARRYVGMAKDAGVEDQLNLKLKKMVFESLGLATEGILRQRFEKDGIEVLRLAINIWEGNPSRSPAYMNGYLIFSHESGQCVIVDPGGRDPRIDDFIKQNELQVTGILNTHGHWDHIQANDHFAGIYKVPVYFHKKDQKLYPKGTSGKKSRYRILPNDVLTLGPFQIRVFHIPGHSQGSVCFYIGDFLISGDTVFEKAIGKLEGNSNRTIIRNKETMLNNLREKVLILPDNVHVLPGHGQPTTIGRIKEHNVFLK